MTVTDASAAPSRVRGLYVETWGDGAPVVLVHGSLAVGPEEWEAQRPLAEEGFRLTVFDRRGYGQSEQADGEDFLVDADDIEALMGDGAHLVGHSYGGIGVMIAAARRPEATRSLTVLEGPVASIAQDAPAWQQLISDIDELWDADLSDEEWVVRFLTLVGSDPSEFPPEFLAIALPTVPVFRRGRGLHTAAIPLDALAAGTYPKLIVSGGHHAGLDAMCAALAERIGGTHAVVEGAGHEIQFTGDPINEQLLALWRQVG
jgi:pimeloyl-ACP methyl ester carboxylesterase